MASASLFGMLVCYFGQYIGMILFSLYLAISTALTVALAIYFVVNFSALKAGARNEARRLWRLGYESDLGITDRFEIKVTLKF